VKKGRIDRRKSASQFRGLVENWGKKTRGNLKIVGTGPQRAFGQRNQRKGLEEGKAWEKN